MDIDFNKWVKEVNGLLEPAGCETVFTRPPSGRNRSCTVGIIHEHRFAFYYWIRYSLDNKGVPPILITIDSHDDVGAHSDVIPVELDSLDARDATSIGLFSWLRLCRLNDGQIMPSLYLDLFSDVYVLLKADDDISLVDRTRNVKQKDRTGGIHTVHYFNKESVLLDHLPIDRDVFLDIDLDYFSDSNPATDNEQGTEIQWPAETIRSFLANPEGVIQKALPSVVGMTIALEPKCCGGLLNSHRALDIMNEVLFENTLCTNETRWRNIHD